MIKEEKVKKEKKSKEAAKEVKEVKDLSQKMLLAAFGDEFDPKAGEECGPLYGYTDEL